jgi:intracellular sulfur oxidation DsrE/DsrF family protein
MKKLLILLMMMLSFIWAETELTEPKPSMVNPRKFVFPITSANENEISHVLSSVANVVKFYGVDKCEVVIVAYSQGIKAVLKEAKFFDKDIQKRLKSVMMYDSVEFIACNNTMKTYKIDKKELLKEVEVVTAGIVEIIERQLDGYIYIIP